MKFFSKLVVLVGVLSVGSAYAARVKCEADYAAHRTRNFIPQFKSGHYIEFGENCSECFATGRNGVTEAGGWTIDVENSPSCNLAE